MSIYTLVAQGATTGTFVSGISCDLEARNTAPNGVFTKRAPTSDRGCGLLRLCACIFKCGVCLTHLERFDRLRGGNGIQRFKHTRQQKSADEMARFVIGQEQTSTRDANKVHVSGRRWSRQHAIDPLRTLAEVVGGITEFFKLGAV